MYGACVSAGYLARKEAVVPEWCEWVTVRSRCHGLPDTRKFVEARLDLEAVDLAEGQRRHFDCTLRNPTAKTYLKSGRNAGSVDGYACLQAAIDKNRRYPPRSGLAVETCAAETYGRLGQEFVDILADLDCRASREARARNLPTSQFFSNWLDTLSAGIARGGARTICDGLETSIAEC